MRLYATMFKVYNSAENNLHPLVLYCWILQSSINRILCSREIGGAVKKKTQSRTINYMALGCLQLREASFPSTDRLRAYMAHACCLYMVSSESTDQSFHSYMSRASGKIETCKSAQPVCMQAGMRRSVDQQRPRRKTRRHRKRRIMRSAQEYRIRPEWLQYAALLAAAALAFIRTCQGNGIRRRLSYAVFSFQLDI